jgi:serine/threonine protein kinase
MKPGTVLAGRFRLDRLLGKGAMGEVWRAHDLRLGRDVAVKLILNSQADDDLLKRFEREARAAARLKHDGIMTVYDSGEDEDGHPFIVMELLNGQNLREIVAGNPTGMPVPRVLDLGIQLAEALEAVHANGIVHWDLHPGNLFVEAGDRLKICDFGISRDNSLDSQRGKPNTVLGAPLYAPPEWWLGRSVAAVEPTADLYVMGEVLYEMLTGSAPFAGSPAWAALMRRHLDEAPLPPRDRRLAVPKTLSELVLRLLAKEPRDRPDATDVAARLREIRSRGEQVTEYRPDAAAAVTAPIACSSLGPSHIEVFVLTKPGSLRHRWFWPDPNWSSWVDMPTPAGESGRATAVAAGSHDDWHQEIAVAVGGTIYHRWWDDGWTDWHGMPSLYAPITDIALSSVTAGHWEIFALDSDGRLHHRWWRSPPAGRSGTTCPDPVGPSARSPRARTPTSIRNCLPS